MSRKQDKAAKRKAKLKAKRVHEENLRLQDIWKYPTMQ